MSYSIGTRAATLALVVVMTACGSDPDGSNGVSVTGSANAAHCASTDDWDPSYSELETAVVRIANERRAEGANCGGQSHAPTGPLSMDRALQCAARLHSKDMADRGYFSHDSPDGSSPWDRIEAAGFEGSARGENIAAGSETAAEVMEQWMGSTGHCSNIMNGEHTKIGVGYYPGGEYRHLWTQTFGR